MRKLPSLLHASMISLTSLFWPAIFVGFAVLIGDLLGYPFNEISAAITYLICVIAVFIFLMFIPEDPELK